MSDNTFRYILRYKIDPLFHADDRIDELLDFCVESRVEEVMMFFGAEELTTGHPTLDELKPYVEMGKRLKRKLDENGIALSLNPWTTIYHVSRGRSLKPGQDFHLLVHENGLSSRITACPLCDKWQKYICETFSHLVRELQPVALWIEDDWRLHNHEPAGGWGGCFCNLHLERFSQAVGKPVTREELLANILASGEPHPWRKKWLEISRDSLLEPARKLQQAISQASPTTRLGLMSSVPDIHSAEGRDWTALQEAIGTEPKFLTRPHMPPYSETPAICTPPSVTRQTLANLTGPLEIYPELENSPRCGQYSKSGAYNRWECLHAAMFGSDGITINHFDMLGNGITLDPTYSNTLASQKDRLNAIVKLGLDDRRAEGVRVLFSPDIAEHVYSKNQTSLTGLNNNSDMWANTLYPLGIAHSFSKTVENDGTPYAVSGQTLRAFDDTEIKKLLSGPILLDAYSVEFLLERGFGELIGIEAGKWRTLNETSFAYESILEEDAEVYGLTNPRMTAQRCSERLLEMTLTEGAEIQSQIFTGDHTKLWPGLVTFTNSEGGRIASLTYPFDGNSQFFMAFFNVFRRTLLQRLIANFAPNTPYAFALEHPMSVYRAPSQSGIVIAAFNLIMDTVQRLVLQLPEKQIDPARIQILSEDGKWQPANAKVTMTNNSSKIVVDKKIPPLQAAILLSPV